MPILQLPFCGREEALKELWAELQRLLETGRGRVRWVTGERGLGKSRLVREWVRALPSSVQVLQADPSGRPFHLASWYRQLLNLDAPGSSPDPDRLYAELLERLNLPSDPVTSLRVVAFRERIDLLLQALGFQEPPPQLVKTVQDEAALLEVLVDLLLWMARQQPLILVIDDAHQLDVFSLALLEAGLPRWQEVPVLLLLTLPSSVLREEHRPLVRLLRTYGSGPAIRLSVLSSEGCARILEGLGIGGEAARSLISLCGGNPLLLEMYLQALIQRGELRPGEGGWTLASGLNLEAFLKVEEGEARPGVRQAFLRFFREVLPPSLQTVLLWASLLAEPFAAEPLAFLLERPAVQVELFLSRAVDLGLVRSMSPGPEYRFAYPFQRRVLQALALRSFPEVLARLEALQTAFPQSLRPEEMGAFAARLGQSHLAWARYMEAAREARKHALFSLVVQHLQKALQNAVTLRERVQTLSGLGTLLFQLGQHEEGVLFLEEAFQLWHQVIPDSDEERTLLKEVLNAAVWVCENRMELERGFRLVESGRQLIRKLGEGTALAREVEAVLALRHAWLLFRAERAQRAIEEARAFLEQISEDNPVLKSDFHSALGVFLRAVGDWEGSRLHHERALTLRRQAGDRWRLSRSLSNLSALLIDQGIWDPAHRYLNEALRLNQQYGDLDGVGLCLANLGMLALRREEWDPALHYLSKARELWTHTQLAIFLAEVLRHLAEAYLGMGKPHLALIHLREALSYAKAQGQEVEEGLTHLVLAETYLVLEDLERARRALEAGWARIEGKGNPFQKGRLSLTAARVALKAGELEEADRYLRMAEARFAQVRSSWGLDQVGRMRRRLRVGEEREP